MNDIKIPSKTAVFRQLKDLGVSKPVLNRVLPSWWDDSLLSSASGLAEFLLILKQRLGFSAEISDSSGLRFYPSTVPTQFKKRSSTKMQKLVDATLIAQAVGMSIVRVMKQNERSLQLAKIEHELAASKRLSLEQALQILFDGNLPVLFIDGYSASMARPAGIVMREHEHFVITLGHKHKSPSTQLFVLLHELGHIVRGHLKKSGIISDESITELGESVYEQQDEQEVEADTYALDILRKGAPITEMIDKHGRLERAAELAICAKEAAGKYGISEGHYALSYGRITRDWVLAHNALKFIERNNAREVLLENNRRILSTLDIKPNDRDLFVRMLGD